MIKIIKYQHSYWIVSEPLSSKKLMIIVGYHLVCSYRGQCSAFPGSALGSPAVSVLLETLCSSWCSSRKSYFKTALLAVLLKWCKQAFCVCVHVDLWKIKTNTRVLSLVIFQSYSDVQSTFELQVQTMHGYNSANLALISWNLVSLFLGRRKKSSVGCNLPSVGDDPIGTWP